MCWPFLLASKLVPAETHLYVWMGLNMEPLRILDDSRAPGSRRDDDLASTLKDSLVKLYKHPS